MISVFCNLKHTLSARHYHSDRVYIVYTSSFEVFIMDMDFVRNRITQLRIQAGKSEYQLSYDLGHSKNYIHNIVNGHSQPSVKELLYLIETLGTTPREFFDETLYDVQAELIGKINEVLRELDEADIDLILTMARRMQKRK